MLTRPKLSIFGLLKELVDVPGAAKNLYAHRDLIRILTLRDFRARFRGSFGGVFWAVFQPLFMMVIYTLVFSRFLGVKFSVNDSPFTFAVYLLCGLLPWNAFSEGMNVSTGLIRGNANLVKRVVFPLEVLPVNLTLVTVIQEVIGFILLIPLTWIVNGRFYWTLVLFPLVLMLQVLFYMGVNWVWSSLAVYFPDLKHFTTLFLAAFIFLTPIFYPMSIIPSQAVIFINLNPFTHLVNMYRDIFMQGVIPGIGESLGMIIFCLIIFMAGYWWFVRTKKGFADVL